MHVLNCILDLSIHDPQVWTITRCFIKLSRLFHLSSLGVMDDCQLYVSLQCSNCATVSLFATRAKNWCTVVSSFIEGWKILSFFIQGWKIVSSLIQGWKMKYDLVVRCCKRQQALTIFITVGHTMIDFQCVISSPYSYIWSIQLWGIFIFIIQYIKPWPAGVT